MSLKKKEAHATVNHDDTLWATFFREQAKWFRESGKEVDLREVLRTPSPHSLRIRVYIGVFSSLVSTFWCRAAGRYVFVSFGSDPISKCLDGYPEPTAIAASNTPKSILSGHSLCELDALYYLINYPTLFRKQFRKLLIGIICRWILNTTKSFKSNIFFVKEDYYNKSSILVSLAKIIPVRIIGIQHGLLKHKYLTTTTIYPGYRTAIQAVYDDQYASLIRNKKSLNSIVYVLGPTFDCGTSPGAKRGRQMLIFVSSADLGFISRRNLIADLMRLCNSIGCDFAVRPHPSELKSEYLCDFPIVTETRKALFNRDTAEIILAGFYSTLLYEAGHKGFRTIWFVSGVSDSNSKYYPEITDLPNSSECNEAELTANWLAGLFSGVIRNVKMDPVRPRLIKMVDNLFPDLNKRSYNDN